MAFSIFQANSNLDDEVQTHIDRSIEQRIRSIALLGAWFLISVIFGYIIATVWDLNGKIYEIAGKQEIQYDHIDMLKDDIEDLELDKERLEKENFSLHKEIFELRKSTVSPNKQQKNSNIDNGNGVRDQ